MRLPSASLLLSRLSEFRVCPYLVPDYRANPKMIHDPFFHSLSLNLFSCVINVPPWNAPRNRGRPRLLVNRRLLQFRPMFKRFRLRRVTGIPELEWRILRGIVRSARSPWYHTAAS